VIKVQGLILRPLPRQKVKQRPLLRVVWRILCRKRYLFGPEVIVHNHQAAQCLLRLYSALLSQALQCLQGLPPYGITMRRGFFQGTHSLRLVHSSSSPI
jgi:hypothetical protein